MPRFDDSTLEKFFIDPRKPAAWCNCPFCPGQLVKGYRKATAGDPARLTLAHTASIGGDDAKAGTATVACVKWNDVGTVNPHEFLVLCKNAGARWEPLVG